MGEVEVNLWPGMSSGRIPGERLTLLSRASRYVRALNTHEAQRGGPPCGQRGTRRRAWGVSYGDGRGACGLDLGKNGFARGLRFVCVWQCVLSVH